MLIQYNNFPSNFPKLYNNCKILHVGGVEKNILEYQMPEWRYMSSSHSLNRPMIILGFKSYNKFYSIIK